MSSVEYGPRKWVVFFSQSGKEIADIAERIGKWPDLIITNSRPEGTRVIDSRIKNYVQLVNKPSVEDYHTILYHHKNSLITLHGWLRIIPDQICNEYQIYNGHPGLITKYDFLKGKDPQLKAFQHQLTTSGCVIHKVTPGVDEGEILEAIEVSIEDLELEEVFRKLRDTSLWLWIKFFYKELFNEKDYNISRFFEYWEEYDI